TGFQPVPSRAPRHGLKTRATTIVLTIALIAFTQAAFAEPTTAPDADAKYNAMIEKRVGEILDVLKLDDTAKQSKVHDILVTQYRALRDWQEANEAKLKDKSTTPEQKQEILATRKPLHDQFLSQLSEQLTPEQVEQVKDKMTYNKVQVTY